MYARGMTARETQRFLAGQYATGVSAWLGLPLEPLYPVVFFDALRVKSRGVHGILIAVADGLKGIGEALAADLRPIHTAASAEAAAAALAAFEQSPSGCQFPTGVAAGAAPGTASTPSSPSRRPYGA